MAEWKDKPIFEVMQTLGDEGFEFAAYDGQNYIFKKPLGAPQQAPTGAVPTRPAQAAQGQPNGQPVQRPTQPVQGLQPRPPSQPQGGSTPPTAPLRSLQRPVPPQDDES